MNRMGKIWILVTLALVLSITAVTPVFAAEREEDENEGRVRFGGDIEVLADETVIGNVVTVGGNIVVAGRVVGDAAAVGGNVDVSGEVIGQVVSLGGTVHLAPTAKVHRGVSVVGGKLEREEGAQVRGEIVEVEPGVGLQPWPRPWPWSFTWGFQQGPRDAFGIIVYTLSRLTIAVALVAMVLLAAVLFPTQLDVVRRTMESAPLQVFGVGVLSAILAVFLTIPLVLTCIGLPLFWLAVIVASLFGLVALALLAGERLLLAVNVTNFTTAGAAIVGILAIWVVSLLPILGGIFMLLAFFFSLGAVVLSRFGTISPPFSWQTGSPSPPSTPKE